MREARLSVDHPSLTPRFVMNGRRVSGSRNVGGSCAQFVGSLGGMFGGLAATVHFLVLCDGEVRRIDRLSGGRNRPDTPSL